MRTLLALAFLFLASTALGDVVVDDFDDSSVLTLPDHEDDAATSSEVGELSLQRRIRFHTSAASYDGVVDVNMTEESALVVDIPTAIRRNVIDDARLRISYTIVGDISDFDAVEIDFNRATADFDFNTMGVQIRMPPGEGGGDLYGVYIDPPPQSTDPFMVRFPLEDAVPLRGAISPVDLTQAYLLDFDLWFGFRNIPKEPNLNVSIDRIRLVRAVPEPSTVVLACLALVTALRISRTDSHATYDSAVDCT